MRTPQEQQPISAARHLDSFVEGLRTRSRARCGREIELRRAWRARLPRLVEELRSRFGVSKVILFGSLARNEANERSDVDLLVLGLDPSLLMDASATANRILEDTYVDIVPAEMARPEVRERAEQEGELLYG